MEMLTSLLIAIVGGVVTHCVVKWLDAHDKDNK